MLPLLHEVETLLIYQKNMPVTLNQFREALGRIADGLSDKEVQNQLDFAYRFSESFCQWFYKRKGTSVEPITSAYMADILADIQYCTERTKFLIKGLYLLPLPEASLIKKSQNYETRY
jgi:hypothetical protein